MDKPDVRVVVVVDESLVRFLRGFFDITNPVVTDSVLIARFIPPACSRIALIFKLDSFDSIILFLRSLMSLLFDGGGWGCFAFGPGLDASFFT